MTQLSPLEEAPGPAPPDPASLTFAVVAAHRRGFPLHPQLEALGARFDRVATTSPVYRLLALPGGPVARGGIWWVQADGGSVEVELHALPLARIGELVPMLPWPLAIGRVELADGTSVAGLICASRPPEAVDVTEYVSWPNYVSAQL